MDKEAKLFMLDAMRNEFTKFMQTVAKIPGSMPQKQQAFIRFDEGHLWMQNAISSFTIPPQPEPEKPNAQLDKNTTIVQEPVKPIESTQAA